MNPQFDIWKMLAGVAIFMLGMSFIEQSLKLLAGRSFKLFLKKQTVSKLKAIGGGAVVTALLQSSSIVNLMVLAFVGSGLIHMQNALAIMLGSNIGTTFTSWIIATAGFQFNMESFALPVTGIAGLVMMLSNQQTRMHQFSKFFFGFSFLFAGLEMMKTAVEGLVKTVDLSMFNHYPLVIFLLVGFLITSLIQSSSATVAIILSALYVHAIPIIPAMAIVLGSETGTTIKLLLASSGGLAAKKRVALGNFLINGITSLVLLFFLQPIDYFIRSMMGISDHIFALVFFQTLVNFAGILLFLPFLNIFGRLLEKLFINEQDETLFIHKVNTTETELAMQAIEKESKRFLYLVAQFNLEVFESKQVVIPATYVQNKYLKMGIAEKYEQLKHIHGDMLAYAVNMQSSFAQKEDNTRLNQLVSAVRNAMYAAKSMKDATHDIELLKNSSNDIKFTWYLDTKAKTELFYQQLLAQLLHETNGAVFTQLTAMYNHIIEGYTNELSNLYKRSMLQQLSETEISTIINYNRELYTSFKSMLLAAKDLLLAEKEAGYFDELPGFIR